LGFRDRGIEIKTPDQIEKMRVAGLLTGQTLEVLRDAVRPGVTTGELDAIAEDHIRSGGGIPSFKGYSQPPFPGSICASVNDQVVHGIPGDRVLAEGDVISIDCGAIVDGWHGDAAITVAVGQVPPEVTELMRVTEGSMWAGFAAMGVTPPGIQLHCRNVIPHARGLGSSSAAIVGGLGLARALVGEDRLPDDELIHIAADLEGHPDNVAPAVLGGFTISGREATSWYAVPAPVDERPEDLFGAPLLLKVEFRPLLVHSVWFPEPK